MNGFWRITVLGFFGAAGVGLALALATSTPPTVDSSTAFASTAAPDAADAAEPRGLDSRLELQGALVEQANPPIAQQAAPPGTSTSGSSQAESPPLPAEATVRAPAATEPTQTEVMERLRQQLERTLRERGNAVPEASGDGEGDVIEDEPQRKPKTAAAGGAEKSGKQAAAKSVPRIYKIPGEGDNNLAIHIQDADLRDVLELLSEQGGLNILPSNSVQGKVSAGLNGVDIDTALHAILRSTGFVARRDGKFIYVGTPQDFKVMEQSLDKIGTRVYRLNYIRASDVKDLVTPLLTPSVGSISVTAPSEVGIGSDDSNAGGNQFAGGDSVLVRDYLAVLTQVDQVIAEVDRKPAQVAIEAMILSVTLDDSYSFGVDFEFLRNDPHVRLATGSPLGSLGDLSFKDGGLKFAYLDGNTAAFVSALETIGDTNVIASPRLMVVNKARAEILIGEQLGYVNTTITETSTAQNVQFLEVGAALRLRPFISSDGMIRMEVHPELSTGSVQLRGQFTLPEKRVTQVTTNIMVPDGCTVIIGGLMREDLTTTTTQVPLLGSLPGVGVLFRRKTEKTQKREILVLITPHLVCEPDACCEGDKSAADFHRRQVVYADQMSPIGKRYLGRRYYRLAQAAWDTGDQEAAMRFIDLAVHFDPENRAAMDLRVDIWNGNLVGDHTIKRLGMYDNHPAGPGDYPGDEAMPLPMGPGDMLREIEESAPAEPVPAGTPLTMLPPARSVYDAASPKMPATPRVGLRGNQDQGAATHSGQATDREPPMTAAALEGKDLPDWLINDLAKPGAGLPAMPAAPPLSAPATKSGRF